MSPEPNRPMSPDGLGGGLGSSVFMDAGVEGLLQPSPINLRQTRCVGLVDGQGGPAAVAVSVVLDRLGERRGQREDKLRRVDVLPRV